MSEKCKNAVLCLKKQSYPYAKNKQIAAMMSISNITDSQKTSEMLKKDGAKGLSTFWRFYVLKALAKTNDMDAALDIIRNYWGLMLKFGATTFWEDFDIEWTKNAGRIDEIVPKGKSDIHADFGRFCYKQLRHSLCHGWASGPTPFLSKYVLGIECKEPGFKSVRIKPNLGNLLWMEGTYPTPRGIISVRHEKKDGKILSLINAPDDIKVITE